MTNTDQKLKNWQTIISDIKLLSIDMIETEGYVIKIKFSDSNKNLYKTEFKYDIYEVSHEEHLLHFWKIKNAEYPNIGNSFEIEDSKWFEKFTGINEYKSDYKHLVISSDDITVQFITETYPNIIKINAL